MPNVIHQRLRISIRRTIQQAHDDRRHELRRHAEHPELIGSIPNQRGPANAVNCPKYGYVDTM